MYRACSILLCGCLLVLGGCVVGPGYQAPQVQVASNFTVPATTQPSAIAGGPLAIASWWDQLHDPLLSDLMRQASQSSLDLRIAQGRVRQARAELAYAGGTELPQVNLNGAYSHNRLSQTAAPYNAFDVPGFPWEYNQYQAGFDASWEIDLFGGVRRGVEAAQAGFGASVASAQDTQISILAEVMRNYVDLRGYQQRLRIAEENLKNQRETLDLTRDRRRQGLITELDVSRAASQVARTQAQLPLLRQRQSEAIHRIATLLGQQPEALADRLAKPANIPVPPPQIAIGVPADLLRRRPDIRRAERELAAATARIGVAEAELYPRLSLTGSFMMISADTSDLFDWRSRALGIGPTISWPVFDAGRLRSVVNIRTAQQEQAMAQYEKAVLVALEETHNAIVAFASAQERRLALADAVTADQSAADIARQQYTEGVIDFLSVLDTERSLYESQDQLADADRAVTLSLVALYKALGGGWQAPDVQPTPPVTSP